MSWIVLEPLVRTATAEVRDLIRRVADARDDRHRRIAIKDLVAKLAGATSAMAIGLAREKPTVARRLSLDLVGRLRHPGSTVRRAVRSLLSRRSIPLASRLAATRALLRDYRDDPAGAARVLRFFVAGLGRSHAIDRLDALAPRLKRAGSAIAVVRAELLDRQQLRCPRCGALRRRQRMARHLWKRHGLLLEGRRARTPWQALDDRLGAPDPMTALSEVHRAILRRGSNDQESLSQLIDEAKERHESLCPNCFAGVPLPDPPPLTPLPTSSGRIAGNGIVASINETGAWPTLRLESANGVIYSGIEPGSGPTVVTMRWAAAVASLLALATALFVASPYHLLVVAALLGELLCFAIWSKRAESRSLSRLDRAIDHAWERLAPALGPCVALSRLALASVNRGDPERRAAELNRMLDSALPAVNEGAVSSNVLPPLWWLRAMDDRHIGRDPLPELVQRLGECLRGEAPMTCADGLAKLAQLGLGSRGERARLRVLGCEQAFAAGLSIGDLNELGRAFPALAQVLGLHDLNGLTCLRLVWDHRTARPWHICGPASTVFDLARYPVLGGQALGAEPDLLLYQMLPPAGPFDEPTPVTLCVRGLMFANALIREAPEHIWVWPRPEWRGGGFELRLDLHRIRYVDDPTELVDRLRHWSNFGLRDFLPRAKDVARYRTTELLVELLSPRATACPGCGKAMIAVEGRIGFELASTRK